MKKSLVLFTAYALLFLIACKKDTTVRQGQFNTSDSKLLCSDLQEKEITSSLFVRTSGMIKDQLTDPQPVEHGCSFESHLKKLFPSASPSYFIRDGESSKGTYNIFIQLGVTTDIGGQYGREGCNTIREKWTYENETKDKKCKVKVSFCNKYLKPNLEFMRVGKYKFDNQDSGTVKVEVWYEGKTYVSGLAANDFSKGEFLEVTEYNSTSTAWQNRVIAYRFNARLKAYDGTELALHNVVHRSGTIGE